MAMFGIGFSAGVLITLLVLEVAERLERELERRQKWAADTAIQDVIRHLAALMDLAGVDAVAGGQAIDDTADVTTSTPSPP